MQTGVTVIRSGLSARRTGRHGVLRQERCVKTAAVQGMRIALSAFRPVRTVFFTAKSSEFVQILRTSRWVLRKRRKTWFCRGQGDWETAFQQRKFRHQGFSDLYCPSQPGQETPHDVRGLQSIKAGGCSCQADEQWRNIAEHGKRWLKMLLKTYLCKKRA